VIIDPLRRHRAPAPDLIPIDEALVADAAVLDVAPPQEPPGVYDPPGEPASAAHPKFTLEPFATICFDSREEWLVKRIMPRQGVGALYGRSQSLKSFVASDLAWRIALGWDWAGRRVKQALAVYIAAEGAVGLRKRKIGFVKARAGHLPEHVPFYLIAAAPNLGTGQTDLVALIAEIEKAGIAPGLIVLDTLAQSLGAGDENGAGMVQLVANATALANHFKVFVLIVHHTGLGDEKRLRGHTSLVGAIDVQILCEREEGALSTILTLQKLKDDAANLRLEARLSRIVVGQDEDGDEVSTLIVDTIEDAATQKSESRPKLVPRTQRLLMDVIANAIAEAGEDIRPFGSGGPLVRAVSDTVVRTRFFARIAERADPDEDQHKMFDRQRKGFKRSIENALKAQALIATERNGEGLVWLP
jgi:hypothetical protein